MTTGLFANKGVGQGRAFQEHRRAQSRVTLDRFADHLAAGDSPERAAARIGKAPAYGRVLLAKIRKELGWQAR